jgi:hypothetical protein
MKYIIILLIFVFSMESCESADSLKPENDNYSELFTDSSLIPGTTVQFKFNSNGLFDTSYTAVHANMCSAPWEYLCYSNSEYDCRSQFEVMEKFTQSDSILNMKISAKIDTTDIKIGMQKLKNDLAIMKINSIATRSNQEITAIKIDSTSRTPFIYYSAPSDYNGKTTIKNMASGKVDNLLVHIECECWAKDCNEKGTLFKQLLSSLKFENKQLTY